MIEPCEFCRIVRNHAFASVVFEDDCAMALLDNRPAGDGHTLVIPKIHCETIYDISNEELARLFTVVKRVALAIRKVVNPDGLTIVQRNGKAAGQHIMHLRIHVIPRYSGQILRDTTEITRSEQRKTEPNGTIAEATRVNNRCLA